MSALRVSCNSSYGARIPGPSLALVCLGCLHLGNQLPLSSRSSGALGQFCHLGHFCQHPVPKRLRATHLTAVLVYLTAVSPIHQ